MSCNYTNYSMSKDEVLNNVAKDPKYYSYCKRVANNSSLSSDLYQYSFEVIANKDESFLVEKYKDGSLGKYYAAVVYKSYNSSSSPFYNEFVKFTRTSTSIDSYDVEYDGLIDTEDVARYFSYVEDRSKILNALSEKEVIPNVYDKISDKEIAKELELYKLESENNWYEVSLFYCYLEYGSYRKLNKASGIPIVSILRSIKTLNDKIKQRLCEKYSL